MVPTEVVLDYLVLDFWKRLCGSQTKVLFNKMTNETKQKKN